MEDPSDGHAGTAPQKQAGQTLSKMDKVCPACYFREIKVPSRLGYRVGTRATASP